MADIRQSIQPTYNSRETGDRYYVTTSVDDRVVGEFQKRIPDPFVRQRVHVGWRDLLRGLLRRRLTVEVLIGADPDVIDDVLELDANTLTPNSTRRAEFNTGISQALRRFAEGEAGDV